MGALSLMAPVYKTCEWSLQWTTWVSLREVLSFAEIPFTHKRMVFVCIKGVLELFKGFDVGKAEYICCFNEIP